MNERIKQVRKKRNLNQEDFGARIGITKSSVSLLESGKNNPSEQTIKLICTEFGVNEVWLRTGEGGEDNMFARVSDDDRFSLNLGKLAVSENKTVERMINAIAETDPEKLHIIEEWMKKCLGVE